MIVFVNLLPEQEGERSNNRNHQKRNKKGDPETRAAYFFYLDPLTSQTAAATPRSAVAAESIKARIKPNSFMMPPLSNH